VLLQFPFPSGDPISVRTKISAFCVHIYCERFEKAPRAKNESLVRKHARADGALKLSCTHTHLSHVYLYRTQLICKNISVFEPPMSKFIAELTTRDAHKFEAFQA
jgi:hypothetical protein